MVAITTKASKGLMLTAEEMDANLDNLNAAVEDRIEVPIVYAPGTYTKGQSVIYDEAVHVCKIASTVALPTDTNAWQILGGGGGSIPWLFGSGTPANELGVNGDIYLDTTTANIYQKAAGIFNFKANIRDPLPLAQIHALTLGIY